MDYISGFGIRCAVLILGLGVSSIAIANTAPLVAQTSNAPLMVQASPAPLMVQAITATAKASITVSITGLRNDKGHVLICLSSNKKKFPDCRKDATARKKKVPAINNSKVVFENVTPGIYALALVHDKNDNDKMDIALFLPKEGFGMSNNPKVRMGKPKFKNSQFTVGTVDIVKNITMKYIL